jgi:hypothetical protein
MRARVVILIVAILAVAGFTALNWAEFTRMTPLNFGLMIEQASLPLILLGALGLVLLAFLVSSARGEHHRLVEYREHSKALQTQRDLADKAEASRFTELRQHLDTQLRETRDREAQAAADFEKTVAANYREVRAQLEQINRTLASRLGSGDGMRHDTARPDVHPGADLRQGRNPQAPEARDHLRDERVEPGQGHAGDPGRAGNRSTIL